jgi:hypothetical protein
MTTYLVAWTTSPDGRMSHTGEGDGHHSGDSLSGDHYHAFETLTEARRHFNTLKGRPTTVLASITTVIESTDY